MKGKRKRKKGATGTLNIRTVKALVNGSSETEP